MTKPMRTVMPITTAIIDDLRGAFGAAAIAGQVRAAIRDGMPTFYASEGGQQMGVTPREGRGVTGAEMVLGSNEEVMKKPSK